MVERLVLRPMIGEPIISVIMVTIGLSIFFQALIRWLFGVTVQPFRKLKGAGAFERLQLGVAYTTSNVPEGLNSLKGETPLGYVFFDPVYTYGRRWRLGIEGVWMPGPISIKTEYARSNEERIRQEMGLFATRVDVAEELNRLVAHLDEVARVVGKGGAIGKRLDFLMQELNREANTLGSKFGRVATARKNAAPGMWGDIPDPDMKNIWWTEEVVNRVMYLSSANLKSADIQLQPAELGRLDIRVNITADQQAQVNFMSGHAWSAIWPA
mgnify:CR=1 FL=1